MQKRWYGVGASVIALLLSFVPGLYDIVWRDSIAHLFPIASTIWSITGGLFPPLATSYVISFLLLVAPPLLVGFLAEKCKNQTQLIILIAVALVIWIGIFYTLSLPMAHGAHGTMNH